MKDIPIQDLQAINTLHQKTWGWELRAYSERNDEFQKFTVFAVDPFTKLWMTEDGYTIEEAVEKFIGRIEV